MASIGQATAEDIPQLAELLSILFTQETDFRPDQEKQRRGLRLIVEAPERGQIFVARIDNKIVGMVSLLFTISTAEGQPACWLEDMVVRPEQRGKGLGSRLVEHAVRFAKTNGFARITLLTDRTNENAIRFYQRHDFQVSEMTPLRRHL